MTLVLSVLDGTATVESAVAELVAEFGNKSADAAEVGELLCEISLNSCMGFDPNRFCGIGLVAEVTSWSVVVERCITPSEIVR